jgi:hypothetical protein
MPNTSRSKSAELAIECKRQSENCLWTSTTFLEWLRLLRAFRAAFTVTPIVLGSFASWNLLTSSPTWAARVGASFCAFLAGLLPAVYRALKLDDDLALCAQLAGEFKNLQDEFRRAAEVSSKKPFKEFEDDTKPLFARLNQARAHGFTAPEFCFRRARRKIESGHYRFEVDIDLEGIEREALAREREGPVAADPARAEAQDRG